MEYVLIIHDVEDYGRWKKGFDDAAVKRREAGELEYQVLEHDADANRIVHFSRWRSLASAKQFFESEEISQLRKELGVKEPEFIYLKQLESGLA